MAPQNDRLKLSFVKDIDVGKKIARNGHRTAIYEVANFDYHSQILYVPKIGNQVSNDPKITRKLLKSFFPNN